MRTFRLVAAPVSAVMLVAGAGSSGCKPRPLPTTNAAQANPQQHASSPSSAALMLLPDGALKRQLILDCTGCHQISREHLYPNGTPRSREDWEATIRRMIAMAGPRSGFPVMGPRDAAETADWLTRHLGAGRPAASVEPPSNAAVTEYVYPEPRDLPHDLAVLNDGRVAITGMFTDQMLVLNPANGQFETSRIPVERANPRSLETGADGNWYLALGAPNRVARYEPHADRWTHWHIGHYAHEARYDGRGRIWFNAHFSRDPVRTGYVDEASGDVVEIVIPTPPEIAALNPVPYGLAIAPDGRVWGTDLRGNRIYSIDPTTHEVQTREMPTPHSGPRRPEFAADGRLWIPEYANNSLTVFDPASGHFRSWRLPIPDALPYVVRINHVTGIVWIGTAAADALVAFDPAAERFTVHTLPTAGALVRHISIDTLRNEVWAAYGASPGIPPKIARLRVGAANP